MDKDVSLFKWVIHSAGGPLNEKVKWTFIFLAIMVGVIIIANTIGVIMWRLGTRAVEKVIFDLKLNILNHINKLSLGYFHTERVGSVMTRAIGDVENISQLLRGSFNLSYQIVQFIVAPFLMISLSPLLFCVVLVPIPFILYAFYSIRVKLKPMYRKLRENQALINSQIQEVLSGIREIKAFNMEKDTSKRYREINWTYYELQNNVMRVFSFNHQLQYGSKDLGVVLIAILGGLAMFFNFGDVTIGKISSFLILAGFIYAPLGNFLVFYDTIQRGMVSVERITEFFNVIPDVQDKPHAKVLNSSSVKGNIIFKNVFFSYDKEHIVLKDISLEVKAGEKIAIVGPTGSGKSTLVSLISRFYDPQKGEILLDGHDIREFSQDSLRKVIGIVFQDIFLFYGSVKENLLFARPDATDSEIKKACKAANIHEEILKLPDDYDTMLGERGVNLSGGQRQRLAIARVFLKDPAIVILDEATSAVDTITEKLIQESVEKMLKGRTAFIIAHRLSTGKNCDRIVVLSKGRIVQIGTHKELVKQKGLYSSLYLHNKFK